jgi:hypothetical protein
MEPIRRWLLSFLYRCNGLTNIWYLAPLEARTFPQEKPWDGPGVRLGEHDEKHVWVKVALEGPPIQDIVPLWDLADTMFQQLRKEAVLGNQLR